jgi:hypothetical protein
MSGVMPSENKKKKIQIIRRRAKVREMYNRGMTQMEIADALGVDQATISRDIYGLSCEAARDTDRLVFRNHWLEIMRATYGFDGVTKRVWQLIDDDSLIKRERMYALSLLLKCYKATKLVIPARRGDAIFQRGLEAVYEEDDEESTAADANREDTCYPKD